MFGSILVMAGACLKWPFNCLHMTYPFHSYLYPISHPLTLLTNPVPIVYPPSPEPCPCTNLLIFGHQVYHVTLGLRKLHLIHALASVPMDESLPPAEGEGFTSTHKTHDSKKLLLDEGLSPGCVLCSTLYRILVRVT